MANDFSVGFQGTRSYANDIRERPVAAGTTITEEGQLLKYVDDGAGGMAVALTVGDATDYNGDEQDGKIAGWAVTDSLALLSLTSVETFNVPAAAPYTVQLRHGNIPNGGLATALGRVYDNTAAALLVTAAAVAMGEVVINASGLAEFHMNEAGSNMTAQYRYNLTAAEVQEQYHERSINNTAQDFFSSVAVMGMEGEMFTSQYDATAVYAVTEKIYSGADGKITNAAGGAVVGMVTKVPSTDDAFLGVKFSKLA